MYSYILHCVKGTIYSYVLLIVIYNKEKMVTIKVTEADRERLKRIKHERFVESYTDVISVLLEEYEKEHPVEAPT